MLLWLKLVYEFLQSSIRTTWKNKEYAYYHLVFLKDVFMVKQCKNELNPMGVTKSSWSREK